MRILSVFALLYFLSACGAGTDREVISRPLLSSLQSDFANRPHLGTVLDPLTVESCILLPYVLWQTSLCDGRPINRIWPQSNFYQTGFAPYWTVLANNESAIELTCNTGAPGKSNKINEEMFFISHENADSITLRVEHTEKCPTIPYLSITNIGQMNEAYGNNVTVDFDVDARMSGQADHYNFYHLYVVFTNNGQRYIAVIYLGIDMSNGSVVEINWNWPFRDSVYYPNSNIRFAGYHVTNKIIKDGNYQFTFNLDEIIKLYYPELANSNTTIVGLEFAVEQSYNYSIDGPRNPIFTEMTINNLEITKS